MNVRIVNKSSGIQSWINRPEAVAILFEDLAAAGVSVVIQPLKRGHFRIEAFRDETSEVIAEKEVYDDDFFGTVDWVIRKSHKKLLGVDGE